MTSTSFRVAGMTCQHCVNAVSEEVGALPGVSEVRVDLAAGTLDVTSAGPLSTELVAAAVDEAGYALVDA